MHSLPASKAKITGNWGFKNILFNGRVPDGILME